MEAEDIWEDTETGTNQEANSPARNSSSSRDEAIMPLLHTLADDFRQFQELFKQVAQSQDRLLEEVQMSQHKLVKILQPSSTSKIAVPINDAILELAETVWQTLASVPPTCKRADRKYYVPTKGVDFLFSHLPLNSLVVDAVSEHGKQQQFRLTPQDKEQDKRLDLFG
ncbi:hypothetical protein UY3_04334 [Chelonia mydas]|uniref:Uncharacterized protein n=1 Tax=Chelonia mydas TaxID=8469 RepID=M7CCI5_CHEMY|nr:hypothetical protein UY3_04334 [Chelonia mydas]